ncbi:MAG: RIP metalloprotease RseP [Lachnospiraceae bacterium]|nr:RIP metalloprotease RseP [Lachnospiraceae bacterium]
MTMIVFVLIFSIVVISHELGHFLLAKMNGIHVIEFSVGMGPTILKKKGKDTLYTLKLLPIGGACMFEGEDGLVSEKNKDENGQPVTAQIEGSFQNANVWGRISTVFAGPFFNLILAFLLSLIIVGYGYTDKPVVQDVMSGYPAESAGIQPGDTILRVNGERIRLYREVSLISFVNRGENLEIQYERDGKSYTTQIKPAYDQQTGRYYIGLQGAGEYVKCKGLQVFQYGAYEVRYWLISTFKSIGMMFQGKVKADDLSGPVGIAQVIGDAIEETKPLGLPTVVLTMINIAILLSVNIGVLNLLPLPALDGGRLVFLFIEVVRGKPVPPEKEGMVHFAGFVLLMLLMVFVLYNDIMRLFR